MRFYIVDAVVLLLGLLAFWRLARWYRRPRTIWMRPPLMGRHHAGELDWTDFGAPAEPMRITTTRDPAQAAKYTAAKPDTLVRIPDTFVIDMDLKRARAAGWPVPSTTALWWRRLRRRLTATEDTFGLCDLVLCGVAAFCVGLLAGVTLLAVIAW